MKAVKVDQRQKISATSNKAGRVVQAPAGSSSSKKKRKSQSKEAEEDSDSGTDVDFVDVNLDFYSYNDPDYHAVKHLLTQLLSHDAKDLDVAGLANHVIDEDEEVGSAVKADGESGDPLAFISVLPWQSDQSYMTSLRDYYLERIGSKRPLLQQALSDITNKIGVVFHERLVNMPIQVVSPLLRSFDADLTAAPERLQYTHLLFVSRTFLASAADFQDDAIMADGDEDAQPLAKKKRSKKDKSQSAGHPLPTGNAFLYHLEDEFIAKAAGDGMWTEFSYKNAPIRGQQGEGEDLGVETKGRVALIDRNRLKEVYEEAEKVFAE